jgi:hypothetical protein
MFGHNKRLERKLREGGGREAWATVLGSVDHGTSTGGFNVSPGQAGSITFHREFRLRVEPDGEPAFEVSVKQDFNDSRGWHMPEEGWSVGVLFDPDDHAKAVMDMTKMPVRPGVDRDQALARHERAMAWAQDPDARRREIEEMRAQALAQGQSSASALQEMIAKAVSGAQAAPRPDVADQLTKLANLRDRGALSDAEFEAQKAKLLAES